MRKKNTHRKLVSLFFLCFSMNKEKNWIQYKTRQKTKIKNKLIIRPPCVFKDKKRRVAAAKSSSWCPFNFRHISFDVSRYCSFKLQSFISFCMHKSFAYCIKKKSCHYNRIVFGAHHHHQHHIEPSNYCCYCLSSSCYNYPVFVFVLQPIVYQCVVVGRYN